MLGIPDHTSTLEGLKRVLSVVSKRRVGGVPEFYQTLTAKKILFIVSLFVILLLLVGIGISIGPSSLGISDAYLALFSRFIPNVDVSEVARVIVWNIRLPRMAAAVVGGVGLALAGVIFQAILRNPLASPYTLGIASAAGFGAALAITGGAGIVGYSGLIGYKGITGSTLVIVSAFAWTLVGVLLIYTLARLTRVTPETLILAGIAVAYLFSSMLSLLEYFSTENAVAQVVYWLMGSLDKVGWTQIGIMTASVFCVFPVLWKYSWDLNAMSIGDETAESLGVKVERVRSLLLILASFITASIICFTGTIGFVGLVAPHIARMVVGGDHRFLIPSSIMAGAVLLVAAEIISRTIMSPVVLPIGAITSFTGIPLFIYLLVKRRREYW